MCDYIGTEEELTLPVNYHGKNYEIGNSAFTYCTNLKKVTIPNSVTNIGSAAFRHCENLTHVLIPNSVTNIGRSAFYYCTNLTNVIIPNSVTFIDDFAFSYCDRLTNINIPNSVTSIGEYIFTSCDGLTSVTIGNSVASIKTSSFEHCHNLTSVTIGESVENIERYAFYDCINLADITIPNSVTNIDIQAFERCFNLSNLTIKSITPIFIDEMFEPCFTATLTVPNGSAKAYSNMGGFWGQFASIKEEASLNISSANQWSTCALAFDAELPEGVRAFAPTGLTGKYVDMTEVEALEANKPYVLYAQEGYTGTLSGTVDVANYQETVTDGVLSGAIVKQEINEGYVLQNQGKGSMFYNVNGQAFTIPAGKCWMSAFNAGTSSVMMRFSDGANDIEGVYMDAPIDAPVNETIYDLEGKPVEEMMSGRVYIVGGKKIMKR